MLILKSPLSYIVPNIILKEGNKMKRSNAQALLTAAMLDLIKSTPLEKITVRQIVDYSKLTRQSFYQHYQDKFDLVNKIFYYDAAKTMHIYSEQGISIKTSYLSMANFLEIMMHNKNFYINSLRYNGQNSLFDYIVEFSASTHQEFIRSKTAQKTLDDQILCALHFNAYGTAKLIQDWALEGMKKSPVKLANTITECMPKIMKDFYS